MPRIQCAYPCVGPSAKCQACWFRENGIRLPGVPQKKPKTKAERKRAEKRDRKALEAFFSLSEAAASEIASEGKEGPK